MRNKEPTTRCKWFVGVATACLLLLLCSASIAQTFSFADIDFWAGTGANRAALAIDWVENSTEPPALVWGYRWDGDATGADMLTAVLAADDRLFAKLGGSSGSPAAVYGLGYDANDDGQFAIDDDTSFDFDGIFYTGPADGAASIALGDYYAEGWIIGFWHYGASPTNPYDGGQWTHSEVGVAVRPLSDGSWDSWTFESPISFSAFAENPVAAEPPFVLPGDYDGSGTVDADDYQLWKDSFGSKVAPAVDGNGNGIVDAADYTIWRDHVGTSADSALTESIIAPEPTTLLIIVTGFCIAVITRRRNRG